MNDIQWKCLFAPESVAVVGASNKRGTWGFGILNNLLRSTGRHIYPVNPRDAEILGKKAYARVADIPGAVDLAVIAVSAPKVPGALRECAEKGVRAAVIISGGFAETGEEGQKLEAELVEVVRQRGLHFMGPNTMGHADAASQLTTLAWAGDIPAGPVSLISQSGNFSMRIIETGKSLGIGFNKIIVTGNETDLHLEDYLEYLAGDDKTGIIIAYIEGLREGRRFLRLAKDITPRKPVVVIKGGGTAAAARAVMSHTGSLAGSAAIYNAAFRQAGLIEVADDDELCDVVLALLTQPLPGGKRIGIMTMGGGLGVMSAEACEQEGLEVPAISAKTVEKMDEYLPPRWSRGNPVDMVGINMVALPAVFSCLWTLMADDHVDAVLLLAPVARGTKMLSRFFNPEEIRAYREVEEKNLRRVKTRVEERGKPVYFVKSAPEFATEPETIALLRRLDIPVYPNPLRAARVLKCLAWYRDYLEQRKG